MQIKVVVDDKIIDEVLCLTGLKTRKEAVEFSLRMLLRLQKQTQTNWLFNIAFNEPEWIRYLESIRRMEELALQ